ncbi:MAG: hypothetical protein BGO41_00940 [Clostridiales bacterium 38-18]|nr:MAG: hypothetical protein BGO41_00940 [Clostridiales bacterium 38-18]
MVISSDILLKGKIWRNTVSALSNIFKTRTNYSIFVICSTIGIMYDKQIESFEENSEDPIYVPRNVISQYGDELDFIFQTAILTTELIDLNEEKRLELAFGEENKEEFDKVKFLIKYANFGITKLSEKIGIDELETIENIKIFLVSTVEGSNFEIDSIEDAIEEIDF